MKKLLILLLLFSACSTTQDIVSQAWVDSVYNQGWYIARDGVATDYPLRFTSNGSFEGYFGPLDMPTQEVVYILDEVVWDDSYAYYSFNYRFNGENLTLYYRIFHGHLNSTGEPGLFWAMTYSDDPPPLELSEQKAWLLKTFAKGNYFNSGHALALKKRGRTTTSKSTTVENNIPNNSNFPRSKGNKIIGGNL